MTHPRLVASRRARLSHAGRRAVWWPYPGERELPTYSIIGAKRAGTSSLNDYITRHPLAFHGFVEKGTRFFDVNYYRGQGWYEKQLPPRRLVDRMEKRLGARPVFGESSPFYALHPQALERLARQLPDLRVIFLLRQPVERAWSHYRYEVARGFESLEPLAALAAESERLQDRDPLKRAEALQHFSYRARGLYGEALRRVLEHYPRESVLVVDSHRLYEQPAATMAEVFGHLGLDPVAEEQYSVVKGLAPSAVPSEFEDQLAGSYDADSELLRELGFGDLSWLRQRSSGNPPMSNES